MPRARCQIARHIVKYTTPRAVGNIMFSLSRFFSSIPAPAPVYLPCLSWLAVPPLATRLSPPSTLANRALRFPLLSAVSHPHAIIAYDPRINSRARRTAIPLTSKRRQRALPETNFSASRCNAGRCIRARTTSHHNNVIHNEEKKTVSMIHQEDHNRHRASASDSQDVIYLQPRSDLAIFPPRLASNR